MSYPVIKKEEITNENSTLKGFQHTEKKHSNQENETPFIHLPQKKQEKERQNSEFQSFILCLAQWVLQSVHHI